MTEEMIINGVNVAGCEFFNDYECKLYKQEYWEPTDTTFDFCKEHPLCEYKATAILERLEQENEKLKKEVKQIGSDFIKKGDYARELEQENKELKKQHYEALKMLKHEYNSRQRDNEQWFTRCTENHNEDSKIIENYRSALEEIKEVIYYCGYKDVVDKVLPKINEVLNS